MTSFSIIHMFLQAGIIVQIIAVILIILSVYSWSIFIRKSINIAKNIRDTKFFGEKIYHSSTQNFLNQFKMAKDDENNPFAKIILSLKAELIRSTKLDIQANKDSILHRLHKHSDMIVDDILYSAQRDYKSLGTIGAISPFIGLFGTVWGIMNSFQHIAKTHNTGLSIVAPGIAEALFVTALGLIVAVPAVIFYNRINNKVDEFEAVLTKYTDFALNDFSYKLDILSEKSDSDSDSETNENDSKDHTNDHMDHNNMNHQTEEITNEIHHNLGV